MKKFAVALMTMLIIFNLVPMTFGSASEQNSWVSKASMHAARGDFGAVSVNDEIFAIGGRSTSFYPPGTLVGTNEVYNITTDSWVIKAPMPTPRMDFAIASYQNKIYCIGGIIGYTVDNIGFNHAITSGITEVYDIISNTWETKAPLQTTLPITSHMEANVVNGKIFVIKVSMEKYASFVYAYDPLTDSWSNKTAAPSFTFNSGPGSYCSSAALNGKIYVTGDLYTGSFSPYAEQQKMLIYNTEADIWSEGKASSTVMSSCEAVATSGIGAPQRIYVFGLVDFPPKAVTQVYDPGTDSWSNSTAMPKVRTEYGTAAVNDILYIFGGYNIGETVPHNTTPTNAVEQYTPVGYNFTVPPETPLVSQTDYPQKQPISPQQPSIEPVVATIALMSGAIAVGLAVYLKKKRRIRKRE